MCLCHVILMTSLECNCIALSNIHGIDYCWIIAEITKSEAIDLLGNNDLSEKTDL